MNESKQPPSPLFDTLEYLDTHIPNITTQHLDDFKYTRDFLYSYRGSEATFNAYRREMERLLQWCWFIAKKSLKTLTRYDIEAYIAFCQNPPAHWIGTKNVSRFIDKGGQRIVNPAWHPFTATVSKMAHAQGSIPNIKTYQLSQKALQAIFAIIGSFFMYLIQEEYIGMNPVALIRQKSKFIRTQQGHRAIRRLSNLQWMYVIETVELLAKEDPEQHERTLFMMNTLFGMYLRISELAASPRWTPQMGHFQRDADDHWWFVTVGKGNKERHISVSDAMLAALKRYRLFLGLSSLPTPGETTPLLIKYRGKGTLRSTRQIRSLVQQCFDATIIRMQAEGFHEEVEQLKVATVHWLRHTGISEDVKFRPREHVRDDAGHRSSAVTDQYIDVELRARHASAKNKKIKIDE